MATYYSVLVTGANRGIGYQFVVDLVDKTQHLIATVRDVEKATELKKIAAKHPNLHILQLEVTDYKRHDSFVAEVEKIVGAKGLTLSIQNAALFSTDNLEECKPETYAKLYDVNVIAPILLAQKLMPLQKKSAASGERTIAAFISSLAGSIEMSSVFQNSSYVAYRISKSALNHGVRIMASENSGESIEFVIFHPGHVVTDMGNSAHVTPQLSATDSVAGMLKHLQDRELIKDGRVITWEGKLLPW